VLEFVVGDVSADPAGVGFDGSGAHVACAADLSDAIEEFRSAGRVVHGIVLGGFFLHMTPG
jgi:hypothetical protein